jgi:hypothetical protein
MNSENLNRSNNSFHKEGARKRICQNVKKFLAENGKLWRALSNTLTPLHGKA